jgi:hypothetical protein
MPANPGQLGGIRMSSPTGTPPVHNPLNAPIPGVRPTAAPPKPAQQPAQPAPLSRTIMPDVMPAPMAQPVPTPTPRPQPRSLGSGSNVAFGIRAVEAVLGGSAAPGTVAVSGSNPAVSYRTLDNGTVEKRNSQFGTVSYLGGGGGALGGMSFGGSNALGARSGSGGALGGTRSGVSGGTRTSGGGYGQGGQHAFGSGFFTRDK